MDDTPEVQAQQVGQRAVQLGCDVDDPENPSIPVLAAQCRLLGVSMSDLFK